MNRKNSNGWLSRYGGKYRVFPKKVRVKKNAFAPASRALLVYLRWIDSRSLSSPSLGIANILVVSARGKMDCCSFLSSFPTFPCFFSRSKFQSQLLVFPLCLICTSFYHVQDIIRFPHADIFLPFLCFYPFRPISFPGFPGGIRITLFFLYLLVKPRLGPQRALSEDERDFLGSREVLRKAVLDVLELAQARMATYFDEHHKPPEFTEKVYIKLTRRPGYKGYSLPSSTKLSPIMAGPFENP